VIDVLTEEEVRILDLLNSRLLAKPVEIKTAFGDSSNGVASAIQRLQSMEYIKVVEPIGEKCYVITKKGTKALVDAKNPEKRAAAREPYGFQFSNV
jgi:hypothetical protein